MAPARLAGILPRVLGADDPALAGDVDRLTAILGRPLHDYREFAAALARAGAASA